MLGSTLLKCRKVVERPHLLRRQPSEHRRAAAIHLGMGVGKLPIGAVARIVIQLRPATYSLIHVDQAVCHKAVDELAVVTVVFQLSLLRSPRAVDDGRQEFVGFLFRRKGRVSWVAPVSK
jgi:hypothetical protein